MRSRPVQLGALALAAVIVAAFGVAGAAGRAAPSPPAGEPTEVPTPSGEDANAVTSYVPRLQLAPSIALGKPNRGTLLNGVRLPARGADYVTWDPALSVRPDREWRRWGTDTLVRTFLRVARGYRAAHPAAPMLVVGDLSRTHGGEFGRRFGGLGHSSHQNGLDIDVYYPRTDRTLRPARRVAQIDHRLAADLLRRFLAIGPQYIFVGPHTGLRGPPRIVQPLVYHDDHMHVRIFNPWQLAGGPPEESAPRDRR